MNKKSPIISSIFDEARKNEKKVRILTTKPAINKNLNSLVHRSVKW